MSEYDWRAPGILTDEHLWHTEEEGEEDPDRVHLELWLEHVDLDLEPRAVYWTREQAIAFQAWLEERIGNWDGP